MSEKEKIKQVVAIDILENRLLQIDRKLLPILLKDRTTNNNILWATDGYIQYGKNYNPDQQIMIEQITGNNGTILRPRVAKSKEEQENRIRDKAEVFTPSWVCNDQNNLVDAQWFGHKETFNKSYGTWWKVRYRKIAFPKHLKKTWQDYVLANRIEITCGEAPYLVSRYDSVSGKALTIKKRIGILDRKLRIITENVSTSEDWIEWAIKAVKSIYGFDWQGDNVLLARENVLLDIIETYYSVYQKEIEKEILLQFAEIISWNIWQMDGIKYVIPNSCHEVTSYDLTGYTLKETCLGCKSNDATNHNGTYCRIMDWKENISIRFVDLLKEVE